jgi:DMSO/TMAO reductase YedYZ molybdopterin-dependent catalytic subunit
VGRRISRRDVLAATTSLVVGCDSRRPKAGLLGAAEQWNGAIERALFSPARLGPSPSARATTPPAAFPVYFISETVPQEPPGWVLRVGGAVDRPVALSLDDLRRMPRTDVRVRHHCVEGWSAVASWHGLRMSDLAHAVGASPDARYVEFRSFDAGYWSSWDRESVDHPQTILAYGMNGDPLAPAHGGPVRLYASVKLGYKMVKYLTEVTFLPHATGGFWEDQDYEWFAGV